jgi:hypothetical protein
LREYFSTAPMRMQDHTNVFHRAPPKVFINFLYIFPFQFRKIVLK